MTATNGTLAALQVQFQDYVIEGAAMPTDMVRASDKADAATLLGVYRDAYALRLLEALGEDHPALKRLLGDEEFDVMGRAYIAAYRSRHRSIRWYGRELAAFVGDMTPWRAQPEIAELAAWEWALGEAMDAADAAVSDGAAFAAVPPERWAELRLSFHPSLRRLDLKWPVPAYRQAVEGEAAELPALAPPSAPIPWAIWRKGIEVFFRSLDADEAAVLDAARAGAGFGAICEMLAKGREPDAAAASAAGFLQGWVDAGLVAGLEA